MFARPEVAVPVEFFEAINETIQSSPRLMQTAYDRAVRGLRRDFIEAIAPPLREHIRPTQWQTIKQQKFWFWALKMGIITWKGRTDALEKGWRTDLQTTEAGGIFSVWNTQPYKIFVQGSRQQRMHQGTWRNEDEVIEATSLRAQEILFQTWVTVADPFAGVPQG